jgi:hypothetical protein
MIYFCMLYFAITVHYLSHGFNVISFSLKGGKSVFLELFVTYTIIHTCIYGNACIFLFLFSISTLSVLDARSEGTGTGKHS